MFTNVKESASRNHLLVLPPVAVLHLLVHMVQRPPARGPHVAASSAVVHVCPTREQLLTPRPTEDMAAREGRAEA